MKCDDDVLYNIKNLHSTLMGLFSEQSNNTDNIKKIGGYCLKNDNVHRNVAIKYHVPKNVYAPDKYPMYCRGPSYVLTGSVVPLLLYQTKYTPTIPMEDTFIGVMADQIGNIQFHNIVRWIITWNAKIKPEQFRKYHIIHTNSLSFTGVEKLWADVYAR